ncbi:MAG: 4a-hydroxytetrahydrobiopterin dehydratase [Deltaproteobacteria bacterium]|nr:4a-hydroxytetrahydrobiopterin dehydratase [Deltaproteobacteria bacterium]MBW2420042.1 4a-hydroxytetrahydrobiopterin dehydratase [Deltaproteobacteria bacterium]
MTELVSQHCEACRRDAPHATEAESHHPSLLTEWGSVRVTWYTTKTKGLHRNDFVMAARTDRLQL